jgi:membrane protease YdiL (CAAX protease family)
VQLEIRIYKAGMDRRLVVIVLVCLVELLMRVLYEYFPIDGLTYTLLARSMEISIILGLTFDRCGIKAKSLGRELIIGICISLLFSATALLMDIASRMFTPGGILTNLILKQEVKNTLMFLLIGCIFAPFVEELFFRGLFYSWMRQKLPAIVAIMISAVFFASMHGHIAPVQLIGGLAFATIFEWRKNIWAAYVLHVLANIGIWIFPFIYPVILTRI